jgi:TRAP-type mannitol/chloroaromatic compound transport system permease small subunit
MKISKCDIYQIVKFTYEALIKLMIFGSFQMPIIATVVFDWTDTVEKSLHQKEAKYFC